MGAEPHRRAREAEVSRLHVAARGGSDRVREFARGAAVARRHAGCLGERALLTRYLCRAARRAHCPGLALDAARLRPTPRPAVVPARVAQPGRRGALRAERARVARLALGLPRILLKRALLARQARLDAVCAVAARRAVGAGAVACPVERARVAPRALRRAHSRLVLAAGARLAITCATHGAWDQQCTEGKVHGVGLHQVWPCHLPSPW